MTSMSLMSTASLIVLELKRGRLAGINLFLGSYLARVHLAIAIENDSWYLTLESSP